MGRAGQGPAARLPGAGPAARRRGLRTVPAVLHEWREMLRTATSATCRRSSSSRGCAPAYRSSWTTPARWAPTGSSTRWPPPPSSVGRRSWSTSAPPPPSTWSAHGASTSAGPSPPGIDISLEALGRRGAQLRKVELLRPRSVIAKNTVEALQSGVLYGFSCQVDGVVAPDARRALGPRARGGDVIATGGLAPLVIAECAVFDLPRAVADPAGPGAGLHPQRLSPG